MSYDITINGKTSEHLQFVLGRSFLRLPPALLIGVGSKAKLYREYLKKNFDKGQDFAFMLSQLHGESKQKGGLNIIVEKRYSWMGSELKSFIEEHAISIESMFTTINGADSVISPEVMERIKNTMANMEVNPESVQAIKPEGVDASDSNG